MKTKTIPVIAALSATLSLGAVMAAPVMLAPRAAQAQQQKQGNLGQVISGLINVNVQNVAVNIGDITVTDVVDVENVLNNNQITALNNVLNNNGVANGNAVILTALLRDVDLITENQVVVGVLNGQFLVLDLE